MDVVAQALLVRVGCEFRYTIRGNVPAIFLVRPAGGPAVRLLDETWATFPLAPYHDYVDVYGNVCRRVTFVPGETVVRYSARVEVDGALDALVPDAPQALVEDLPDAVLHYTLPSRFCLSDELGDEAWRLFGETQPGWERVQAICDYVHREIVFDYMRSSPTTTSRDALAARAGVCRDFAHLAIAFARAMNIPARYAFGYLPDVDVAERVPVMDFAAWMEVYLGDRWYTFDARNNRRRRGRVVIARGRDALDVAMVTTFGDARFDAMTVTAEGLG